MVKLTRSKSVPVKKKTSLKKGAETSSPAPLKKEQIKEQKAKKKGTRTAKKAGQKSEKAFIAIQKEILPPKNHKVTIVDKTAKNAESIPAPAPVIAVRSPLSPAVLSSVRFPLVPEKHLGMVSKVIGIFFIISGVFLSFLNLYAQSSLYSQLPFIKSIASIIGTKTEINVAQTTVYVKESEQKNSTGDQQVRVAIDSAQPLQGTVPVSFILSSADTVVVLVENITDHTITTIGNAVRIDTSTWNIELDTTYFANGDYRIRTVVNDGNTTFERVNEAVLTFNNQINTASEAVSETNSDESKSEEYTRATTTSETLAADFKEVKDEIDSVVINDAEESVSTESRIFKISVNNAADVRVYAHNNDTHAKYYIGRAQQKDQSTWYIDWNLNYIPPGEYDITARATVGGLEVTSNTHQIVLQTSRDTDESFSLLASSTFLQSTDLRPTIDIALQKNPTWPEKIDVTIGAPDLDWVELYAQPVNSLTPFFLGMGKSHEQNTWTFSWDTKNTPNGEYGVYARGKTQYGFVEGKKDTVHVLNGAVQFTKSEEQSVDALIEAHSSLTKTVADSDFEHETGSSSVLEEHDLAYVQPVASFMNEITLSDDEEVVLEQVLVEFRKSLDEKLTMLGLAERKGDQSEKREILGEIETLKQNTLSKIPQSIDSENTLRIEGYVYQMISIQQEIVISNETVLRNRIGDAVSADSDADEVSDYDEVNLYQTNPFVADTDGDRFPDGLEIKGGFDPHNSNAEALVVFESPKDFGTIREDILSIDAITELQKENNEMKDSFKALISGKALPHSFVTIYLFSNPVITTVRTDGEGVWSYVLDKELEEGTHEMYIGITDNKGHIVAKSALKTFVKNENSLVLETENESEIVPSAPPYVSSIESSIYLLGAILIVTLGLILLLLNYHVSKRHQYQQATVAI